MFNNSQNNIFNNNINNNMNNINNNMNNNFNNNFNNNNNNQINLLSIMNSSILVQEHNHPFIYCFTIERANHGPSWKCNKCGNDYTYNIPSFYCIFCDCDLCENCFLQYKIADIIIFNYNNNNILSQIMNPLMQKFNWQIVFPCHNHFLSLIRKVNLNYYWICKLCNQNYPNSQSFYYCSLCDFYLCQNCANKLNNQMDDSKIPDFLK